MYINIYIYTCTQAYIIEYIVAIIFLNKMLTVRAIKNKKSKSLCYLHLFFLRCWCSSFLYADPSFWPGLFSLSLKNFFQHFLHSRFTRNKFSVFGCLRRYLFLLHFLKKKKNLFIYFWLCWVFLAARRLSLVVVSGGYSSLLCAGFSLRWLLLLRSTGSRRAGFSSCGTQAP